MAGVDEVLIHQLTDVPSYFDFYDCLKAFGVLADNWINYHRDILPENHIVVLDIKLYSLSLVPKVNIFFFQKFLLFLLVRYFYCIFEWVGKLGIARSPSPDIT